MSEIGNGSICINGFLRRKSNSRLSQAVEEMSAYHRSADGSSFEFDFGCAQTTIRPEQWKAPKRTAIPATRGFLAIWRGWVSV